MAGEKALINVDADGLALQGYDVVAFFTVGAPVPGKAEFSTTHRGARYQFHSARNLELFRADPGKYEPQFGGYCAFGVGRGALVPVRIEAWQIVDGRLLLQKNRDIRDEFNRDPAGNLRKADERWPKLVEKKGK